MKSANRTKELMKIVSKLIASIDEKPDSATISALQRFGLNNPLQKRELIVLPKRIDAAKWLALIRTLSLFVIENAVIRLENLHYRPGDKILLNGCNVEFLKIYKKEKQIKIRCSNGNYTLPFNKVRSISFGKRGRLDKLEQVSRATNYKTKNKNIGEILGLEGVLALPKYTVLVTRFNEFEDFLKNHYLGDTEIRYVFPWGKVNRSGEPENINPRSSERPNCIVAPDLNRLLVFLEKMKNKKPEFIVIDGFEQHVNQLFVVDDILNSNIPVLVIAEESELIHLGHLKDRDFRESRLHHRKEHDFKVEIHEVLFSEVTELYRTVSRIRMKDRQLANQIKDFLNELGVLTFQVSVLLSAADINDLKSERIISIKQNLEKIKLWIPSELEQEIRIKLDNLESFEMKDDKAPKLLELLKVILNEVNRAQTKKVLVLTNSQKDADRLNNAFAAAEWKDVNAITVSEWLKSREETDKLIIYFWPGKKQGFKILSSHAFRKLAFILYPHEKEWLKQNLKRWQDKYGLEIPLSQDNGLGDENLELWQSYEDIDTDSNEEDFEDLELRLYARKNHSLRSNVTEDGTCKARFVIFKGKSFALFTDQHRLMVVTDLVKEAGKDSNVRWKVVNQLEQGDIVLFRDSDNDLIREIADDILKKNNLIHLRQTSSIWRAALLRRYKKLNGDINRLQRELHENGCNRHLTTIRNWLFNENVIGPRDINDIVSISKATKDQELNEKIHQVIYAVTTLWGAHLQAAGYLKKQLIRKLPNLMEDMELTLEQVETLKLGIYGKITLASVDRVFDEYIDVKASMTNKLLTLE